MYKSKFFVIIGIILSMLLLNLSCGDDDNKITGSSSNQRTFENYFENYSFQSFYDAVEKSDATILAGGQCDEYIVDSSVTPYDSLYNRDALIVKYSPDGDTLWSLKYGNDSLSERVINIVPLNTGGVMALSTIHQTGGPSSADLKFQYITDVGELGTFGIIDDLGFPGVQDMIETSDNGFIIAGNIYGYRQRSKLLMMKIDSDANKIWEKIYLEIDGSFERVKELVDGDLLFAGNRYDTSSTYNNIFIMRTNLNGDSLLAFEINLGIDSYCYDIIITEDGGYKIAGTTTDVDTGFHFIIETDSNGVTKSAKYAYHNSIYWTTNARFLDNGDMVFTGYRYYPDQRGFLVKVSSTGDLLWTKEFYNNGNEIAFHSLYLSYDGGYLISGMLDKDINYNNDALLYKTNSNGIIDEMD